MKIETERLILREFTVDDFDSWHGRMRACRGVGAAKDEAQLHAWNEDHMQMLNESAPEVFNVKHYVSVAELQVKSKHKIH